MSHLRPSRSLRGKVAIVTGAGSAGSGIGNGRATAILLAEAGSNVLCCDLSGANAAFTVELIQGEGHAEAIPVVGDVTDEAACRAMVDAAVEKWGRVDILVNNVGIIGPRGNAVEVDLRMWEAAMRVNVLSMVNMVRACVPVMRRNEARGGIRGAVINVGSVAGLRGDTPSLLYPTAKGAVVNMTRAMANHHAPDGIRVNCVCPGMLYTPMMYATDDGSVTMSEVTRRERKERSLLKTEGTGWDCAAAVRFLAGDEARWITGAILPVDAGATAVAGLKRGMAKI